MTCQYFFFSVETDITDIAFFTIFAERLGLSYIIYVTKVTYFVCSSACQIQTNQEWKILNEMPFWIETIVIYRWCSKIAIDLGTSRILHRPW